MPIIKSSKKALRQNKRRRITNLKNFKKLKDVVSKYKKALETKNQSEAKKLIPIVYKQLDKAAKTGLIKKNKASRLKSRLSRKIASLK